MALTILQSEANVGKLMYLLRSSVKNLVPNLTSVLDPAPEQRTQHIAVAC